MGFKALSLALTLTCVGVPFVTGCSSSGDSHEKSDEVGTIKLALQTTGADGATYAFPADAYLVVTGSVFTDYLSLYGSDTTLNRTLAAGTYTATLYFGSGSTVLQKTEGGVTTTVNATWTNPQPVTFTITKGQTTPIALHFTVKGLGDVVFDTGTLAITADVQKESSSTFSTATAAGTTNLYYSKNADDTAAYATNLQVAQSVDLPISFTYTSTSAWSQVSSNAVCQSGTLSATSSSGSPGLIARLEELAGASAWFCVNDYGANDYVGISFSKYGAPPPDQASFLADPNYGFYAGISFYAGDVYDGTTLKQTALANATYSNGFFYHELFDASFNELTTVSGYANGTLTLTP
jgi:hypothetical protein